MAPDELEQVLLDPETIVSGRTLAGLFGVSQQTVTEWARAGVVVRVGRGAFRLLPSCIGVFERLRGQAAGHTSAGGLDLVAERARLAKEQADATAIKNAVARGEYIPVSVAQKAWGDAVTIMRTRILALPSKVAPTVATLTAPIEVQRVIEKEAHAALEDLGRTVVRSDPSLSSADGEGDSADVRLL